MLFYGEPSNRPKIVVVMPAYNAAKTLKVTFEAIPHKVIDQIILVDDGSSGQTLEIARQLQLTLFVHTRNYASSASFLDSVVYGLSILVLLARFLLHKIPLVEFRQFESLPSRYRRVS